MSRHNRKIATILAADVVDYSRLMAAAEAPTLAALKVRRAIFDRLVDRFGGHEFGSVGDSLMAQFGSAVDAIECAQTIQREIAALNDSLPTVQRMFVRVGVNLGDVIEEDGALYGDGVNVAARVQALADPGGVLVTASVHEQVKNKFAGQFHYLGPRRVKNIPDPVVIYALLAGPEHRARGVKAARRIGMIALGYLLCAAVIGFLVWLVARRFHSPDWTIAAFVTLAAIGFVIAMRRATSHVSLGAHFRRVRVLVAASAVALAIAAVVWVWRDVLWPTSVTIVRPEPRSQPAVAVAAFRNLAGDPKIDWMSEGIANLVRDGLAESSHVVVVSPTRWQTVLRNAAPDESGVVDVFTAASKSGIDYVVSGEFLAAPDGLVLTARLSDVTVGVEIAPYRASGLTAQSLLGEATSLVQMAKRGLGVPHTETVASFSTDLAVHNMAAYEAYLSGINYFLRFDYRAAEQSLRVALRLAPDFQMARYRLAHVQVASGDTEAGLATLAEIPDDAPLTRRERGYVAGARALFARDAGRAQAIYSKLLREFPYDVEARWLLVLAYDVAYEDESAVSQLRVLLNQEPQNDYLWSYLAETYLRLGKFDLARQALDRYLTYKPRDPFGFTVLAELDQLSGNLDGAAGHLAHALELQPDFSTARLALARNQALRGRTTDALTSLNTLTTAADVPPAVRIDAAFDLSGLLRGSGQFAAAARSLADLQKQIDKEYVRAAMALAQRGEALAELGQFKRATTLIDEAVTRAPGAPTRYLFARARLQLKQGDAAGARATVQRITQLPPSQDGAQEEVLVREDANKAARFMSGIIDLATGDTVRAAATLESAVALPGYQYSNYKLGLARALLATGRFRDALAAARAAASERDINDIRLDLEIDRARAVLLEAEILDAMGDRSAARKRARAFLELWHASDPGQADRVRAEQLANASTR